MLVKAISDVQKELIHQEHVCLIFPRGYLYLGGTEFTHFENHAEIAKHLTTSGLRNRVVPNRYTKGERPSDSLYWLRVKLMQVRFSLTAEHVETRHFTDLPACRTYIQSAAPLHGALWEGHFN